MPQLAKRPRRLLVLVHLVVSLVWMGGGAANVVLGLTARLDPDGGLAAQQAHVAVHVLDLWLVIPAAFSALVTGLLLSWLTPWGFARHWWVLVKLVLTVGVIVFSTFGVGVWVELLLQHPRSPGWYPTALVAGGLANLVAFLVMTVLSHYKPRGLTPWATASPRPRRQVPAG